MRQRRTCFWRHPDHQGGGIKVPGQIAFIGFDNHPASEAFSPPLTTISVPRKRLGFLGAQTLLRLIGGDRAIPEAQLLPYEFRCGRKYLADRNQSFRYIEQR